jgi:hypothetical protein
MARAFEPSVIRSSYALARSPRVVPDGWSRDTLEGWTLLTSPELPALALEDATGMQLGWVVGHPVDLDAGRIVRTPITTTVPTNDPSFVTRLDEDLHRYAGRWVALVLRPQQLILPDGDAALPALFAPELEAVVSNPFLLAPPDELPHDSPLVDVQRVWHSWMPFGCGTTPLIGVELLKPNHVLDLSSWSERRVWPRGGLDLIGVEDGARELGRAFEGMISAAADDSTAFVSLTAGGDTRVAVASCRAIVDRVEFFTVAFPDPLGTTDVHWAPVVAERFGLRHRILPWKRPTDDDIRRFMYLTGCQNGEPRGRLAAPSYAQLGGDGVYVSGLHGNMVRGEEWRSTDRPDAALGPADLVTRLLYPLHPELLGRAEAWLAEAPPLHSLDLLTLAQFEACDSGWGGTLSLAYPDAARVTLYPNGARSVLDAMLRVPWQDRRADRVRTHLIESRWPELLEIPFNKRPFKASAHRRWILTESKVRAGFRKAGRAVGALPKR